MAALQMESYLQEPHQKKKLFAMMGSDKVNNPNKDGPQWIWYWQEPVCDALHTQGKVCKTSSYSASKNNCPDIYYHTSTLAVPHYV
jgi:hypothetical protein